MLNFHFDASPPAMISNLFFTYFVCNLFMFLNKIENVNVKEFYINTT